MREEDGQAAAADPYGWTVAAQDADEAGDAYSWRDAHAPPARARTPEPVHAEADPSPTEALADSEPQPGPQVAPPAGEEPYGWTQGDAADAPPEPVVEAAAEPEATPARARRPRRPRKAAAEPATDTTAEFAAEEGFVAPEPATEAIPEPEPAPTLAQAEPAPEQAPEPPAPGPIAAAAEPDPAEISAPPPEPKRGWWRRVIR